MNGNVQSRVILQMLAKGRYGISLSLFLTSLIPIPRGCRAPGRGVGVGSQSEGSMHLLKLDRKKRAVQSSRADYKGFATNYFLRLNQNDFKRPLARAPRCCNRIEAEVSLTITKRF